MTLAFWLVGAWLALGVVSTILFMGHDDMMNWSETPPTEKCFLGLLWSLIGPVGLLIEFGARIDTHWYENKRAQREQEARQRTLDTTNKMFQRSIEAEEKETREEEGREAGVPDKPPSTRYSILKDVAP